MDIFPQTSSFLGYFANQDAHQRLYLPPLVALSHGRVVVSSISGFPKT